MSEVHVDCRTCGAMIGVPPVVEEGGEFSCPSCSDILLNVSETRSFRWDEVDPFIQAHGVNRNGLWGGVIGSSLWLGILVVVMAIRGRFDFGLLMALAVPFAGIVLAIVRGRASCPSRVYGGRLGIMLGAYMIYVGALMQASPRWADLLLMDNYTGPTVPIVMALGASTLLLGVMQLAYHRRLVRSVPSAILIDDRRERERHPGAGR